jgi:hypothetical protein
MAQKGSDSFHLSMESLQKLKSSRPHCNCDSEIYKALPASLLAISDNHDSADQVSFESLIGLPVATLYERNYTFGLGFMEKGRRNVNESNSAVQADKEIHYPTSSSREKTSARKAKDLPSVSEYKPSQKEKRQRLKETTAQLSTEFITASEKRDIDDKENDQDDPNTSHNQDAVLNESNSHKLYSKQFITPFADTKKTKPNSDPRLKNIDPKMIELISIF